MDDDGGTTEASKREPSNHTSPQNSLYYGGATTPSQLGTLPQPPPPPRIHLPAEIVIHIAEYLDRQALGRASRVCRFWRSCLEPPLWADIPSHALENPWFRSGLRARQIHVRRLSLRSHRGTNRRGDIGTPEGTLISSDYGLLEDPQGWSTDVAKNRLSSLRITFGPTSSRSPAAATTSSTHHSILPASPSKCLESQLLDLNHSTLQELYLTQWPRSLYGDILHPMLSLSNLRRLKLEDWSHINGRAIRLILESCPHLQSLLLPMNTMIPEITTFWELRSTVSTWKYEAQPQSEWTSTTPTNHYHSGSSTAVLLQQITQQQPLQTIIEELTLDRSAISMDLVLNLAHVCPELKVLSLEETYGLGVVELVSESEEDGNEDDDEGSSLSSEMIELDSEGSEVDIVQNEGTASIQDVDQQMSERADDETFNAEENLVEHPPSYSTFPTVMDDLQQDLSQGSLDTNHLLNENHHAGHAVSLMDAQTEAEGEAPEPALISFLDRLYQACPRIQSFNFNQCSSDGLDDFFMISLLMLWGPNELKSIRVRNVGIGSRMFLLTLAHTCGSTLTCLDLSMDLPLGGASQQASTSLGLLGGGQSTISLSEPRRIPETITLFQEFPMLVFLDLRGVAIKTSWVDSTTSPWSCTRLKTLRISVESAGIDHDLRMYEQLGRLTALQELVLTRIVKGIPLGDSVKTSVYDRYPSLDLSLDAGLDQLKPLVLLKLLDIRDLGHHCLMNRPELEWMARHWPSLQILEGLQDLTITADGDIQEELKRLAWFQTHRPSVTIDDEHGLSRRRTRRPVRDSMIDCINRHEDSAELDRPGGRCSRELMYESLRPRGGRSPSPLRTWY